ncbi:autophagy protein 6, partial [Ascosphaera acerosa]
PPKPAGPMERAERLFDIISARSDIDHPVCTECTDLLLEQLGRELATATKERDTYVGFLTELANEVRARPSPDQLREELGAARAVEAAALQELRALEADKARVDAEVAALEAEARELDRQEEAFWQDKNAFWARAARLEDERDAAAVRYGHDLAQLEALRRTNVYADAFAISHDGPFATINGLRLGRLADHPVDWAEINAAWGQALLLLVSLAARCGFKFRGYRLRPLGSRSTIEKIECPAANPRSSIMSAFGGVGRSTAPERSHGQPAQKPGSERGPPKVTTLDLFATDMSTILPFPNRRFDNGMAP